MSNWKRMLEIAKLSTDIVDDIKDGVLRKKCPKCGGNVYPVGNGIIREKCSKCGEFYSDRRIGGS